MNRIFVSAAHKSSGKTTISLGLAAALRARGLDTRSFKKGPDYIDPMWLKRASGRECHNLDFNVQTKAEILAAFVGASRGGDIAIVEGNKGLHDGVDLEGSDSSAALAKLLRAPIVLVVDAFGMTRGIAPLVQGYARFDRKAHIAGIILNQVGPERQTAKLVKALERYTDIPVLGAIGRDNSLSVSERHLGLTTPEETCEADAIVAAARDAVANGVDLDRLLRIAASAPALKLPGARPEACRAADVRIAVARDTAFGFYYADDLQAFAREGAEIVYFDSLNDKRLPDCDGLFIGGGFPETQAARLSANFELRNDIREAIGQGLPTYAECGGLMYLTRAIHVNGERHEMVGAIEADARMHTRPQGRGLVALETTSAFPWRSTPSGTSLPAHEFHYAALENLSGDFEFAYRVRRGFGIDGAHDGIVSGSLLAGFSHLRDASGSRWVAPFLDFVRTRSKARPAQRVHAVTSESHRSTASVGEVYLVGAGPGDPDLLTLRALRLMRSADVVLWDRLADAGVMNLIPPGIERIYVGKRPSDHELPQADICALMVRLARQGKRVLRLKGGDPFMFGRGGEEIESLAENGVPFQVCPGITAAAGASAYAGIPLTHRDHAQACVFVTGHGKDGHVDLDWKSLVQPNQTVAVYMGLRNLETLTQEFIVRGARADMPAAIVDNATRVNQRVIVGTLQSLPGLARSAKLRGPSILIIGTVVTLRGRLTGDSARDASRDLGNSTFAGEIPAPVEVCEI